MEQNPLLDHGEERHWCTIKTVTCTCVILLIFGVSLVIGIPIGAINIVRSKQPFTLLHQDRVTSGETYQIEINNQSDTHDVCMSDLCSTSSCSNVMLTIDPILTGFAGELDASCCKLDLTETNTLTVTLNQTIEDTKSFSDWVFHLHRGSTLNLTFCVEATGPTCGTSEDYIFVIIQGKENFSLWSGGHEFRKYTNNFTTLRTVADCQSQSTTLPLYTYSANADYYHVIRNSAEFDCDIRVFAYATFERKQYYNNDPTPCTVGIGKPSCNKSTAAAKYVTVQITDIDSKVTNWTEQVSFWLTCDPIINNDKLAREVVPAFAVPALVMLLGSGAIVLLCTYWWRRHYRAEVEHRRRAETGQL